MESPSKISRPPGRRSRRWQLTLWPLEVWCGTRATVKDSGRRCDLEAGMAKLFSSDVAHRHTWTALQLHGGLGFASESPVNRFWRDAALLPLAEGTDDIQREIIARRLFGE